MSQIRFPLLEVPVIISPEAGAFLGDAYSFQDFPELLLVATSPITRVRWFNIFQGNKYKVWSWRKDFIIQKKCSIFLIYIGRNLVNMCENAILRVLDQRKQNTTGQIYWYGCIYQGFWIWCWLVLRIYLLGPNSDLHRMNLRPQELLSLA